MVALLAGRDTAQMITPGPAPAEEIEVKKPGSCAPALIGREEPALISAKLGEA